MNWFEFKKKKKKNQPMGVQVSCRRSHLLTLKFSSVLDVPMLIDYSCTPTIGGVFVAVMWSIYVELVPVFKAKIV